MLYSEAFKILLKDKIIVGCMIVIVLFLLLAFLSLVPGFVEDYSGQVKGVDEVTKIERSYHPPTLLLALGVIDTVNNKPLSPEQKASFDGGLFSRAAWRLPFGANLEGNSVLAMSVHGIRLAFIIGLITTVVSIVVAVPVGAVAGYFGGIIDDLIVWFYTTLVSIPYLLLLIALITSLPEEVRNDEIWALYAVLLVIGITTWVSLARLIRAEFMKHRQREYVQAARALGFGNSRILFGHILPNVSHIVIITFTISFIGAVNLEVFLSFIGVGIRPEVPTWGQMITKAKDELTRDPSVWWPLTSATMFLFILSLAFSIFGDALRDALDPKLRTG